MTADHERWVDARAPTCSARCRRTSATQFEAHLAACAMCREEVDELRPAADALPMASPQMAPPPALKDRIMAEVEREAELLAQAGAERRPARARAAARRRSRLVAAAGWRAGAASPPRC